MDMKRVVIVGAGGAGKTVLARQLGAILDLPVTHLDALRYDRAWRTVAEETYRAAQRNLVSADRWLIEGNSLASLPIRAARADTIIVLDQHPLVCLAGILHRRLRYRGGQHPDGVFDRITPEVIRYVLGYRSRHLPRVLACIREHGAHAQV
ncbi:topology modulation protein [Actinoplanes sp. NPDC000266]